MFLFAEVSEQALALQHPRFRRQATLEPSAHLDQLIDHLLSSIPHKISTALSITENLQHFKVVKRVLQGWAIVVGSWLDMASDYFINNRTASNYGGPTNIYTYGVKGFYGVGFGFPLLLGLPEEKLSCGPDDFIILLDKFQLTNGLYELFSSGISFVSIRSIVGEFDILVRSSLGCILDFDSEVPEAADVAFALEDLVKAIQLRIATEEENEYYLLFK